MRLRLTPAQEALRDELRAFLDAELPPEHEEGAESAEWARDEEYVWVHAFNRRLGAAGWSASSSTRCITPTVTLLLHSGQRPRFLLVSSGAMRTEHPRWPS